MEETSKKENCNIQAFSLGYIWWNFNVGNDICKSDEVRLAYFYSEMSS